MHPTTYVDAQLAANELSLQDRRGQMIVYQASSEKGSFEAYVVADDGTKVDVLVGARSNLRWERECILVMV